MLFVTVAVTILERRTSPTVRTPSFIAETAFGSGDTEFQVVDRQVHTTL
jgi:hypothetical protein